MSQLGSFFARQFPLSEARKSLKDKLYDKEIMHLRFQVIKKYRGEFSAVQVVEPIVITGAALSDGAEERKSNGNHITTTRRSGL